MHNHADSFVIAENIIEDVLFEFYMDLRRTAVAQHVKPIASKKTV